MSPAGAKEAKSRHQVCLRLAQEAKVCRRLIELGYSRASQHGMFGTVGVNPLTVLVPISMEKRAPCFGDPFLCWPGHGSGKQHG